MLQGRIRLIFLGGMLRGGEAKMRTKQRQATPRDTALQRTRCAECHV